MNYGLYMATTGLTTSMYRMDVAANNLANINTVAFKPQQVTTRQRDAARIEDNLHLPSNKLLERLGNGIHLQPNRISFEQGPTMPTGEPLDVAFKGDGFFVLRDGQTTTTETLRLSRDGRFARNADGLLVQSSTGLPVLDAQNKTITIPPGVQPEIGPDGVITQSGRTLAQLRLVDATPTQRQRLKMQGDGLFKMPADVAQSLTPARGLLRQGEVEHAAVDPIQAMMQVTDAGRDAERAAGFITNFDRMMERAINGLGRTS